MHVPPIMGTAEVKFKVLDGTEPILSVPMLVANGNRVVFRGEDAMLKDDWYFKVLIKKSIKFIRFDTMLRMSTNFGSEFEPGDGTT